MANPPSWRESAFLKFVNVIACFALLAWNIHTRMTPGGIDYFGPSTRQTYFSPAPWVYSIWTPIYVLLCGSSLWQFTHKGEVVFASIPWGLPALALTNFAYLHLRATDQFVSAAVVCVILSIVVTRLYYGFSVLEVATSLGEALLFHVPFSLLYAWVTYLGYLSLFEVLGINATEAAGGWTKFFVFLSLSHLKGIAATTAAHKWDFFTGFVVAWTIWAVHVHQTSSGFVNTVTLVYFIITLVIMPLALIWGLLVQCLDALLPDRRETTPILPQTTSTRR